MQVRPGFDESLISRAVTTAKGNRRAFFESSVSNDSVSSASTVPQ
jgi:hypothetical protein